MVQAGSNAAPAVQMARTAACTPVAWSARYATAPLNACVRPITRARPSGHKCQRGAVGHGRFHADTGSDADGDGDGDDGGDDDDDIVRHQRATDRHAGGDTGDHSDRGKAGID